MKNENNDIVEDDMVAPKKVKKYLEYALTELSHWITQHSHSPNQPTETSVRDLPNFVAKLEKQISHFVEELIADPTHQQTVAREFKAKCDYAQRALSEAILPSSENSQTNVNVLKQLSKTLSDALKKLAQVFKELLKSNVMTQTPTFTPHHEKPVVHLDNEQRHKSHEVHGQTDNLRHYNIPPGKKG